LKTVSIDIASIALHIGAENCEFYCAQSVPSLTGAADRKEV